MSPPSHFHNEMRSDPDKLLPNDWNLGEGYMEQTPSSRVYTIFFLYRFVKDNMWVSDLPKILEQLKMRITETHTKTAQDTLQKVRHQAEYISLTFLEPLLEPTMEFIGFPYLSF